MENYPYFQFKWNKKGVCTHIVRVLVSEERFEDLVEECFGEGQEEVFAENQSIREACLTGSKFGKFLKEKKVPIKIQVNF